MTPPEGVTEFQQRKNLELLRKLDEPHQAQHDFHPELAARLESYELAFRMQAEMPEVIDLSKESPATLDMYGIGGANPDADSLGRRCLLARRLVERRVRFVQVIAGGWDSHDYIEKARGCEPSINPSRVSSAT